MNNEILDVKIELLDHSMNVEMDTPELNVDIDTPELNAEVEAEELNVEISHEEISCNIENKSVIETNFVYNYTKQDNVEKDVNFYDYDGTLLYSFYADQFLNSTSMPPLPYQVDLVCQGWNWDYETLKTHVQKLNKADVGAMYTTYDGKSRIYFSIQDRLEVSTVLGINGIAIIDWGDGTSDTISGTIAGDTPTYQELITVEHTYPQNGLYTISIENDSMLYVATILYNSILDGSSIPTLRGGYNFHVKKINWGNNVYFLSGAVNNLIDLEKISFSNTCYTYEYKVDEYRPLSIFINNKSLSYIGFPRSFKLLPSVVGCDFLTRISIPDSIERYDASAFKDCTSIERIILPITTTDYFTNDFFRNCKNLVETIYNHDNQEVDYISEDFCLDCVNLKKITIGRYITQIFNGAFENCKALNEITIEGNIEYIEARVFRDCSSLTKLKVKSSSVINMSYAYYLVDYCYSLKYIDFSEVYAIPLINGNVFNMVELPADVEIIVPDDLYNDWINATNWSNLAEHIVKASEV